MRKSAKTPKSFHVEIEKLVHGGMGLGRHKGQVIFVPFSVPGDHLRVRAVEEKKKFIRAKIEQIEKPGDGRTNPACPHFGKCGGCHLQHMGYMRQVEAKRLILEETLRHRFPETRDLPVVMRACTQPVGYRSRARVQVRGAGPKASVGFFRHRSHTVEDVEHCPLFRPALNEALSSLKQFKIKVDLDGTAQEMDIACSQEEGTWATVRVGAETAAGGTPLFGKRKPDDVLLNKTVGSYRYSVTASVFFQANDFMVQELAAVVQELAAGKGHGSALDLFSGVGLFSLPLARQFAGIVAVESSSAASRLCAANASAAGYGNVVSVCADAAAWMKSEESSSCSFDLIVLDPPRTGAGADVMKQIQKKAPATVIYVSCDPQTLVRDLACIAPGDYTIDCVQGMDMFPQTYHFETVVRLIRN